MAQRPRRPVSRPENWLAGRKVISKGKNWSPTLVPSSKQGKQGLHQKQTKTDARQKSGRQGAQPGDPKTSLRAPKVVYDHKSGLPDHSGPLGQGKKVWFKNHAKRRTLSDPETRRAAEGSKNRKLVSKREMWSTTTKEWSTRPLPPSREEKQGSICKPSQSTKSSKARRQGPQPKL